MLKNFIFATVLLVTLSGCSSSTSQQRLIGSGSFDSVEAAKTRVSLGLTYLQNGNFTQAKFNLDKALEFAPRSADAHYAMAYYYEQVSETALAEAAYQKALDYEDSNPDILNSYGAFLCKQGQYDKAKSLFLSAVNSKSYISTAETYENLALCSQSQGLKLDALEYFKSALNHQPTRPQSLFLLAQLQQELGQYEEAKKTLWKYERNASVSAESLFLSYQIADGLQDTKGAVGYGDLMSSMFPNHRHTATYKQQMGKFRPVAKVTQKRVTSTVAPVRPETSEITPESAVEMLPEASQIVDVSLEAQSSPKLTESALEAVPSNIVEENEAEVVKQIEDTEYHLVKPKENLYRISLKYNVKMSRLMEWNDLQDPASIRIGMKLRVKDPN